MFDSIFFILYVLRGHIGVQNSHFCQFWRFFKNFRTGNMFSFPSQSYLELEIPLKMVFMLICNQKIGMVSQLYLNFIHSFWNFQFYTLNFLSNFWANMTKFSKVILANLHMDFLLAKYVQTLGFFFPKWRYLDEFWCISLSWY